MRAKYDAIIVGSGAGGGVAALLCARAGMSVLVLEAGPAKPFLDAALASTEDRKLSILAAACIGGGSGLQWNADPHYLDEDSARQWSKHSGGIDFFVELAEHYAALAPKPSYLAQAAERGAHLLADARVENAHVDRSGRVHGVNVYFMVEGEPRRRTIAARRVIVAAGALRTPGILAASGVRNAHLGKHLRLHPTVAVLADGKPRALVSICDRDEGWVCIWDVPRIAYQLSRGDAKQVRDAAQTLPSGKRTGVFSVHQMGTARMHDDPALGVVDADGRVHGHPNIIVADASVFPDASGVGPMQTVMALAHRAAGRLIANG